MTCSFLLDLNVALAEPVEAATVRVRCYADANPHSRRHARSSGDSREPVRDMAPLRQI